MRRVYSGILAVLFVGLLGTIAPSPASAVVVCDLEYGGTSSYALVNNNSCTKVQARIYIYWGGGHDDYYYGAQSSVSSKATKPSGSTINLWYYRGSVGTTWSPWKSYQL
jgi:hypothetical protein